MGREASMRPGYEILAYITTDKERVITGKALAIFAHNDEELETITTDIRCSSIKMRRLYGNKSLVKFILSSNLNAIIII